MFQRLFGRESANRAIVDALYDTIVAAARQPAFYSQLGVPDTPLGRFEMISLHLFLILRRLRSGEGASGEIAQQLVDGFFRDLDHSLRELGIGDSSVPKRARKLAKMFYGRIAAYDGPIDSRAVDELSDALARNIRPDLKQWGGAAPLAAYVLETSSALASQPSEVILAGQAIIPLFADECVDAA